MKQYTWLVVLLAVSIGLALAFGDKVEWVTPLSGSKERLGFLWILINFVALALVLEKLIFRRLRTRTVEKHESIRSELDRATAARNEAEILIGELRGRLDGLEDEAERLQRAAREQAEADRKRIIAEAEAEAERIRATAKATAEREAQARIREIESEVVSRAVDKAETLLRQRFSDADQRRMVDDYVASVQTAPLGPRAGGPS